MPKVGNKEFSYSKAGYAAAKKEAAKTGKKMVVPKGYHLMPNGKLMKGTKHKGK